MAGKGILLTTDNDLNIIGGAMVIGDTTMQETAMIIGMNQGEMKSVPMLGPNLMQMKKINASRFDIEKRLRVHLALDGKDWSQLKPEILKLITKL